MDGFQGLLCAETLFTFLVCWLLGLLFTRPNHAETSLLQHLTLAVPVGDPGGQAHSAAFGARTPLRGLLNTVDAGVRDFDPYSGFWPVGWKGQASQCPLLIWATGPLFAALSRHSNFSWSWAVRTWQQHIQLAAGHTANLPISAGAVVLTVWFKLLSAAVNDPIEHAVVSLENHAYASLVAGVCTAVTVEAAALVAGLQLGAALPALAGAHQTAGAAVQHRAHPRGASRRCSGALERARGLTALGCRNLT